LLAAETAVDQITARFGDQQWLDGFRELVEFHEVIVSVSPM
jgi:hypothetical protein